MKKINFLKFFKSIIEAIASFFKKPEAPAGTGEDVVVDPEPETPSIEYETVTVCKSSGKRPGKWCKETEARQFEKGKTPTETCALAHATMCPRPLPELGRMIGWSLGGYEALSFRWQAPRFTQDLWDDLSELKAEYGINLSRYFAYCLESAKHEMELTVHPLVRKNGKYGFDALNPEYVEDIGRRLESDTRRRITTQICIFTSITGSRFKFCPFHGDKNNLGTVTDAQRFYDDPFSSAEAKATNDAQNRFIELMVKAFDGPYIIWEIDNEPVCKDPKILYNFYIRKINKLKSFGVPTSRIAVEYWNSGLTVPILELGVWMPQHVVGSPESVQRIHQGERQALYKNGLKMVFSSDGGDVHIGDGKSYALGVQPPWWTGYRQPSSQQMQDMFRIDLANGGFGGEINSATHCAMDSTGIPDLRVAIRAAKEGLGKADCAKLGIGYDENKKPEFLAIQDGCR